MPTVYMVNVSADYDREGLNLHSLVTGEPASEAAGWMMAG